MIFVFAFAPCLFHFVYSRCDLLLLYAVIIIATSVLLSSLYIPFHYRIRLCASKPHPTQPKNPNALESFNNKLRSNLITR